MSRAFGWSTRICLEMAPVGNLSLAGSNYRNTPGGLRDATWLSYQHLNVAVKMRITAIWDCFGTRKKCNPSNREAGGHLRRERTRSSLLHCIVDWRKSTPLAHHLGNIRCNRIVGKSWIFQETKVRFVFSSWWLSFVDKMRPTFVAVSSGRRDYDFRRRRRRASCFFCVCFCFLLTLLLFSQDIVSDFGNEFGKFPNVVAFLTPGTVRFVMF